MDGNLSSREKIRSVWQIPVAEIRMWHSSGWGGRDRVRWVYLKGEPGEGTTRAGVCIVLW